MHARELKMMQTHVESAASALSLHVPNWKSMIDVHLLEMNHSSYCIVGQILRSWKLPEWRALTLWDEYPAFCNMPYSDYKTYQTLWLAYLEA